MAMKDLVQITRLRVRYREKHDVTKLIFFRSIMADEKEPIQSVQVFGRKKTATAVAYCKRGKGLIKVNGRPLELVEPRALQFKLQEPILLLGKDRYQLFYYRFIFMDGL